MKKLILKFLTNIKTTRNGSSCVVDPTGLAPVSPCGNSGMLHIYTTGPGPHLYSKTEKALFQGLSLCHTGLSVMFMDIRCCYKRSK
ncbi:MAG: hypothetical protein A3J54_03135 [Candidatus Ryanbacteria bacterium RIFCSPHIGHO2_02_FULL_45_13b]|uniref:Uncharacterized protein n=1 Tax=Candidatus Ryanbacteria bacterium RIFCSPHIGHO2_02_FULL_45_13b TaxID=1802117 RepID=A0A1G2G513_9BACT|nr:MAG: hypothetical protein A3J54_03135 [Candidatus Ryanbacteria bacterium RIFCSPHIGHO2_02_FULL_45_13b]